LGAEVVDFVGLSLIDQFLEAAGVGQIAVMQDHLVVASCRSWKMCMMRPVLKEEERRMIPCTS